MEKKENPRKAKDKPVKIIVEPVYVGEKSISEAFFEVIYNDLLKKSA
jgi:hypothetical protein